MLGLCEHKIQNILIVKVGGNGGVMVVGLGGGAGGAVVTVRAMAVCAVGWLHGWWGLVVVRAWWR